jgi:hypothetical protein
MIKLDSEYGAMAADKYGAMAMGQNGGRKFVR